MRKKLFWPRVCAGLMALLAAWASGCGSGANNKIVPVQGKIVFADGKALPEGTRLRFDPADGTAKTAEAVSEADGSFKVKHSRGSSGAEVGKYVVVLLAPTGDSGAFYKIVPKRYYEGGEFPVEVKEGMPALELKVQMR